MHEAQPVGQAAAHALGAFDIAMARADGEHKVAIERCLTLEPTAQQACKDQADADYQAAANIAKAIRVAQQQQPQPQPQPQQGQPPPQQGQQQ